MLSILLRGANMARGLIGRSAVHLKLAMALGLLLPATAWAQTAAELKAISKQAEQFHSEGKYAEAIPLAERVLAARERTLGQKHADTLSSMDMLAFLLRAEGRYAEAEPLNRRAVTGRERLLGREHPDTLTSVNNLAMLYKAQGRYREAEPLFRRVLLGNERVLGTDHPTTLANLKNMAGVYKAQGRYAEAEPLLRRSLEARERLYGVDHADTLKSANSLALLYKEQARYGEAETLQRRVLEGAERVHGPKHPDTLTCVANLALLYTAQSRYGDAEPLFRRAFEGRASALGPEHPHTLGSADNLAELYANMRRFADAEPLFRSTLEARERLLGSDHPDTLLTVNNLAALLDDENRHAEAEPLYLRALTAQERTLGPEHPNTLTSLNNLAGLYSARGRYAEAEQFYRRAIAASEHMLGRDHPNTLTSVSNLATSRFAQRNWDGAATLWRRTTATLAMRTLRGASDTRLTGSKKSEAEQNGEQFLLLVKSLHLAAIERHTQEPISTHESFQAAQWALSSDAAQSVAQMAVRSATGNGQMATLVRERQDFLSEWQKRDAWRNATFGQDASERDTSAEAENTERLAVIDARIAEIDRRMAIEFPDYAALASPGALAMEEVQGLLRPDEALVLFLDTPEALPTPEETFIWVVTRTDIRWVRSVPGTSGLAMQVKALRCGLDRDAWSGPDCTKLTGVEFSEADANSGKPIPFDSARAHALYKTLFAQVEDIIKGKHLLIVPSGSLTQLPFHVLITAPPASSDYKKAAWLTREHAITILPAVSSLKALRRIARPSTARLPMIGIGNPLLDGPQDHPRYGQYYAKQARLARDTQQCRESMPERVASLIGFRGGVKPRTTRGGPAQDPDIKTHVPLPETVGELCAVARDLRADFGEMRLGARATEREIKMLSASGQLSQYRLVHFATHGALAGELKGTNEPGLILTPPGTATEEDDGYLSASEIAALKLDADWVILSACNTAAGDATGAQALSGLARAFIYAQARALLVSHWPVDTGASVKLVTRAMREMTGDVRLGRAQALRRAMLTIIDEGEPREAHPAYWGPFIVVGEGAH